MPRKFISTTAPVSDQVNKMMMYIPVYSWGYSDSTTAMPSVGLQDLPLNLVVFATGSAVFVFVLSLIFCCHLVKLRLKAQREINKYNEVIKKGKARNFDCYETCAVCLEDFTLKDKLGICPCRHAFHRKCLVRWLEIRKSCPMCITPILLPGSKAIRSQGEPASFEPTQRQRLLPSAESGDASDTSDSGDLGLGVGALGSPSSLGCPVDRQRISRAALYGAEGPSGGFSVV
ncbi:RING finger protein 122-like isoform X1 [Petromyzon marinus]|uniref:RING finger protein 24-like isoform X1 n=2 Tax=Petromyzon marinus TaxID=7757 RepID=A0AAJ7T0F5_PETMA|nr:RING finger protein 24-like isoform X1 [Petromyzon marinus]